MCKQGFRRHASFVLLILILLGAAGCGDPWGTAQGTVILDGQPLKKGVVTFHPVVEGSTAYATLSESGTFIAMTGAKPGLPPGEYQITVIDQTIPTPGTNEIAKLLTPEKYASTKTSDLKVTITRGSNRVDLVMKK